MVDFPCLCVSSFKVTGPPLAYLLIPANLSTPNACTALFRITNSPGVNIAGTVSLSPVPGTIPPLANPIASLAPLRLTPPLNNWLIPLPILNVATVASNGSNGFKELVNPITAFEILINTSAKNLKLGELIISDIKAPNSFCN